MLYIDLAFVIWIIVLTFLVEVIRCINVSGLTSKIYVLIAKSLKLKKYRNCCKYVKAIKEAKKAESAVNSKEEFAKWAKLRRKVEKYTKEHSEAKTKLSIEMAIFQGAFRAVLYLILYGILLIWALFYNSTPSFVLPTGFLGPLEFIVSLPYSAIGTVSTLIWIIACFRMSRILIPLMLPKFKETIDYNNNQSWVSYLWRFATADLPPETLIPSDI